MHISEGVLSVPVLAAGAALTLGFTVKGLRSIKAEDVPATGIVSAGIFVASLIHISVGPSSVHLLLNGVSGAILGWAVFPACLVALFLQAMLFQFGGLTTLGVNVMDMAFPGLVFGAVFRAIFVSKGKWGLLSGAFLCGVGGVLLTAVMTAGALALTGENFTVAAKLIVWSHIPVALIEGVVGAMAIGFLARTRPNMIGRKSGELL
ncbi:cobalt transporter CbiM [Dethiosulfovibrio salsuginis]|uniref:Cobalt/nickel transport system permease protein n=1 Tax=Dethiosulfovibrio salsuginis TaxID=561720 RepID=A0A1X7J4C6_9BACT|nr:cobalt transporter CbiM [Dethiosulfovibrio salsuginis]SMG22128.1 cobalt/nickel transport system permease protein [Dethiosulfovibrio salsuginis]